MNIPIELKSTKIRFFIIFIFFLLILLSFIYRAYVLTFFSPVKSTYSLETPEIHRGIIFDSNYHELAVSLDSISIAVRPSEIKNLTKTVKILSASLNISKEIIRKKILKNSRHSFFWLKRKIQKDKVKSLLNYTIPGIIIKKNNTRYYPNNNLASSLLGFVNIDNVGLSGLEYLFNEELSFYKNNSYTGKHIVLTLNSYIQYNLEKILRETMEKTKSKSAISIISEVKTGKILAMTSLPNFNANHPFKSPAQNRINQAISLYYEPGSTFKMFTVSSLIKENLLDEEKVYYCPGFFQYNQHRINCNKKHEGIKIKEILKASCNTGIIKASWRMPILRFYSILKSFGFGSLTEIDLPGEIRGSLKLASRWDLSLKMSIPIGQGLGVTPIQLITAANAIANGGFILKPMIIDKILSPERDVIKSYQIQVKNRAISKANSKKMLSLLQSVITKGGTGYRAHIPGFTLAGKTGTSQMSNKQGYMKGKYQASFLGFFPGDKPEISVLIIFSEPQGRIHHGGNVAAPVFKKIIKEIAHIIHKGETITVNRFKKLKYNTNNYSKYKMPNFIGKSKKEVMRIIWKNFSGEHSIKGSGYVTEQLPLANTSIKPPYKFIIKFQD